MKKIFNDYGGVVVTVVAIVALIGLVVFLMTDTGVMSNAFGRITSQFVEKSEQLIEDVGSIDGNGGSGESGESGGNGGAGESGGDTSHGLYFGEKYTWSDGSGSGDYSLVFFEDGAKENYLEGRWISYSADAYTLSGNVVTDNVIGDFILSDDGMTLTTLTDDSLVFTCEVGQGSSADLANNNISYGSAYSCIGNAGDEAILVLNSDGSGYYSCGSTNMNFPVGTLNFDVLTHAISGETTYGTVDGLWSRDGKHIYFSTIKDNGDFEILIYVSLSE